MLRTAGNSAIFLYVFRATRSKTTPLPAALNQARGIDTMYFYSYCWKLCCTLWKTLLHLYETLLHCRKLGCIQYCRKHYYILKETLHTMFVFSSTPSSRNERQCNSLPPNHPLHHPVYAVTPLKKSFQPRQIWIYEILICTFRKDKNFNFVNYLFAWPTYAHAFPGSI
jgi:hypothetical protein